MKTPQGNAHNHPKDDQGVSDNPPGHTEDALMAQSECSKREALAQQETVQAPPNASSGETGTTSDTQQTFRFILAAGDDVSSPEYPFSSAGASSRKDGDDGAEYARCTESVSESVVPEPPEAECLQFRQSAALASNSHTDKQGHRSKILKKVICISFAFIALVIASSLLSVYLTFGELRFPNENFALPPIDKFRKPPVISSDDVTTNSLQIERADVGTGVTMHLTSAVEKNTLTKQEIYKKCSPSVVAIQTQSGDDVSGSWGSGVILSEDGYVITNAHVLEGDVAAVTVVLSDDREFEAKLVGMDVQTDLAILKIDAHALPAAEFGDSSHLEEGEEVLAIGNPLGAELRGTVTNGIISAIDRDIDYGSYRMTLLQTTAAINQGNSGGPLINMYGQVIGVTHMKFMSYYSTIEGIAFAIPTRSMKPIVDQLIATGQITGRPALGIKISPYPTWMLDITDAPEGVYVAEAFPNTDAHKKGISAGDIIIAANGAPVQTSAELNVIKDTFQVGDPLTLTVYRNGDTFDVEIILCDMADLNE